MRPTPSAAHLRDRPLRRLSWAAMGCASRPGASCDSVGLAMFRFGGAEHSEIGRTNFMSGGSKRRLRSFGRAMGL